MPRILTASASRAMAAALAAVVVVLTASLPVAGAAAPTTGADPDAEVARLAERFVPVVVIREQTGDCTPGEPFRPVPVDTVLNRDDVVLRDPDGAEVMSAPTAADLAGRTDGFYLDLPGDPLDPGCDYEEWFREIGSDVPDTVYARVATDPEHPGRLVLQYWFFWIFNDWNDKHEGDWEMIQLLFDADDAAQAVRTDPLQVAFAQHEGSEVADWDDAKLLRDGDHVAVYPGEGSHAAYFTQAHWFGKSAAAGFGCDNTAVDDGVEATELRPGFEILTDQPWLKFAGRWGQKEPSFNNGPTGPNAKAQWEHPVTWQVEQGRPDATSLPPVPGSPEEAFCGLTAAGSLLFIDLLDHPVRTVALLVVAGLLAWWVIRATRWWGSPAEPDRERRAGQIILGPLRLFSGRPVVYGVVATAQFVVLAASAGVQSLLAAPDGSAELTEVGAADLGPGQWLLVALVATITVLAAAFGVVTSASLTGSRPAPGVSGVWRVLADRGTSRGAETLALTYAAVTLCALTVVLLPLGAYLAARWSVAAPAAALEGYDFAGARQRSAELVLGRKWRALGITTGLVLLVSVPGPLLGALLLLLTPLPFWLVNLIALAVVSVSLTLAGIGLALHLYDLRPRRESATVR